MTDLVDVQRWVTIRTGDFAGQSGIAGKQRGTALYVEIPGIGYVLCRVADVEFRAQRGCVVGKVVITDLPDEDARCTWCGHSFNALSADQYREVRETGTLPHTERKS